MDGKKRDRSVIAWLSVSWLAIASALAGCVASPPEGGDHAPGEHVATARQADSSACADGVQSGDEGGVDCGGSCSAACLSIQIDGHADVLVGCAPSDYDCQARLVCGGVTGLPCVYQSYDCATGTQGSYYPPDGMSGSSSFNFAITYDLRGGSYGNICACDTGQMSAYGLGADEQYCGLGHWHRVGSDVATCFDAVQSQGEEGVD